MKKNTEVSILNELFPGRSMVTNLHVFSNHGCKTLDSGGGLDVIHTSDISKAFDIVDHDLLLLNLYRLGASKILTKCSRLLFKVVKVLRYIFLIMT